jgi:hypothetical protein
LAAVACLALLGACSSAHGAGSAAGPAAARAGAPDVTAAPRTTPVVDNLVGFGATVAHWNQHHRSATAKSAVFGDVQHDAGRVVALTRYLPSGTSQTDATKIAAKLLPPDAKITWQRRVTSQPDPDSTSRDVCYYVQFTSATLVPVINDEHGAVFAELNGPMVKGAYTYQRSNVRSFDLSVGEYSQTDPPPC